MKLCKYCLALLAVMTGNQTVESATPFNLRAHIREDLATVILQQGLGSSQHGFANIQEILGYREEDIEQIGPIKNILTGITATTEQIDDNVQMLQTKSSRNKVEYNQDITLIFFYLGKLMQKVHESQLLTEASTTLLLDVLYQDSEPSLDFTELLRARYEALRSTREAPSLPESPYNCAASSHRSHQGQSHHGQPTQGQVPPEPLPQQPQSPTQSALQSGDATDGED
jgi:hypothetical protein